MVYVLKTYSISLQKIEFIFILSSVVSVVNVLTPSCNEIMNQTMASTYFQTIIRNSCVQASALILVLAIHKSDETFVYMQMLSSKDWFFANQAKLSFASQTFNYIFNSKLTRDLSFSPGLFFQDFCSWQSGELLFTIRYMHSAVMIER